MYSKALICMMETRMYAGSGLDRLTRRMDGLTLPPIKPEDLHIHGYSNYTPVNTKKVKWFDTAAIIQSVVILTTLVGVLIKTTLMI